MKQNKGTPLWKALIFQRRLPWRYKIFFSKKKGIWYYKPSPFDKFKMRIYEKLNKKYMSYNLPKKKLQYLRKIINYDKPKKISIVVATRNKPKALKNCFIKSLKKLDFDKSKYNVIISDNSSNNATFDYIQSLNIENLIYVREKRKGIGFARNKGIKEATGDVIVFIDDDCSFDKDWLNRICGFYNSDKKYLLGQGYIYDSAKKRILNLASKIEKIRVFCGGNISFRKKIFDLVSFNEGILYGDDEYDLINQIKLFWPNFNFFIDKNPIIHHRHKSEYRDENRLKLNQKGIKTGSKGTSLRYLNKFIMKRNLNTDSKLFKINFLLKEILFFPLELFFISFDFIKLFRTKKKIYKQLNKIKDLE